MLSIFAAAIEAARQVFVKAVREDVSAETFTDLVAVEQALRGASQEFGRELLQAFCDERLEQAKQPEQRPVCERGHRMELNRNSSWTRDSLFGSVQVSDVYAYCRVCGESARPLHAFLGTDFERWSLDAQEVAVDLCADESCERAMHKFGRLFPGVEMDRSTARHFLNMHGERARAFIEEKLRRVAAEGSATSCALEIEVEVDGGMVPVATLEDIEIEPGQEPERTPVRGLIKRKKNCRYEEVRLGVIQLAQGGPRLYAVRPNFELDDLFHDVFALARELGLTERTDVRGIADGAHYIRKRLKKAFDGWCATYRFILDRPHAKEHLAEAAAALEAWRGDPAGVWAKSALDRMERGDAADVVAELKREAERTGDEVLRLAAGYFENNKDSVKYAAYREKKWSTASSEVESANRHVVQVRLKISGAWWDPENVPNILALRMLKANGWWDEYWDDQRARWHHRAAEFRARLTKVAA